MSTNCRYTVKLHLQEMTPPGIVTRSIIGAGCMLWEKIHVGIELMNS